MIALLHQRQDRGHLRRHAGTRGEPGAAVFERRHALLEDRRGRIGQAHIDIAESLQVEQARGVLGVLEDIGRRLVNRYRARAGDRVGDLPRVQAKGLDAEFSVSHGFLPPND